MHRFLLLKCLQIIIQLYDPEFRSYALLTKYGKYIVIIDLINGDAKPRRL